MAFSLPSLRQTLDTVDEFFFNYIPVTQAEEEAYSIHILSCQVQSGAAAGMFNNSSPDGDNSPRLFTGERLYTRLAARHTLLIDSARVLTRLKVKNGAVSRAIELAKQKMETRCYASFCAVGECRHLSIAYMRYLIACNTPESNQRLERFLTQLAAHRDAQGRWGSFPFYYTLLMLQETGHPLAIQELSYASRVCTELFTRARSSDLYAVRRETLLVRAQGEDA